MEKVFRVNLAVAFLLTVQKPQVEVALMISGLKRLINELFGDSPFIGELLCYVRYREHQTKLLTFF